MSKIARKNVVITGGARGLGRLIAMKMAQLGGRVVVYDVAAEALEAVVAKIRAAGREANGYAWDASARQEFSRGAGKVKARVGPVAIVVNKAGIRWEERRVGK